MNDMEYYDYLRHYRNLEKEDVCPNCNGSGIRMYGNTSTWRGGIGGCAMTNDICDKCWGSGNKHFPWVNLRVLNNILTPEQKKALTGKGEK